MSLPPDKLQKKRALFIERTARALAITDDEARQLLSIARLQSVRINTLKTTVASAKARLTKDGVETQVVPWMPNGLHITGGRELLSDHDLTASGDIYIQNAASWLPVLILNPQPDSTVLDVCAAPGGKTSHIAELTHNSARITANDNSRPRLFRLQRNLERLGVEGASYTLHDATRLSRHLDEESFDSILLDAPCSGEGMMILSDAKGFESWSVAHIKRLQTLQKKLIVQAWKLLKPGGTLVYSTCTMAPEENEAVIDYLLRHNDDAELEPLDAWKEALTNTAKPVLTWNDKTYDESIAGILRLAPSKNVEAFFVAKLVKKPTVL